MYKSYRNTRLVLVSKSTLTEDLAAKLMHAAVCRRVTMTKFAAVVACLFRLFYSPQCL